MNINLFLFCIVDIKEIRNSKRKHDELDTTAMMIVIIMLTQVFVVLILLIICTYLLENCKNMNNIQETIQLTSLRKTFVTSLITVFKSIYLCVDVFVNSRGC